MNTAVQKMDVSAAECPPVGMKQRQAPLRSRYMSEPQAAMITDSARTLCHEVDLSHPVHGQVVCGDGRPVTIDTGIHRAVGGYSDLPNPGEILAAALAACLDGTIRIIANMMDVQLTHLAVSVDFKVDVRGTLMMDPAVPVGFQDAQICVEMAAGNVPDAVLDKLLKSAEHCCVVMQTLRNPPAINVNRTAA